MKTSVKKVLILAYDFPPYLSVGALRPAAWFRYFKDAEVEPIVITRQWHDNDHTPLDYIKKSLFSTNIGESNEFGTVIRAPYKPNLANRLYTKYGDRQTRLIRKFLMAIQEIGQFFLPIGNKRSIYRAADVYLELERVDFIVATGDPFVLFHYAKQLSEKHDIPWIADYRDPWSNGFDISNSFQRRIARSIEKRTLKSCSQIVTVNDFFKEKIASINTSVPIEVIPNGYDHDAIANLKILPYKKECLTIAIAGNIYAWHPINEYLSAFLTYCQQTNHPMKTIFYGVNIKNEIQLFILTNFPDQMGNVEFVDRMPNQLLLERLSNENVLLLLNYFEIVGTKIYDYLGLNKKILFCFTGYGENHITGNHSLPSSEYPQVKILEATNSGILAENPDALQSIFSELFEEWQNTGEIKSEVTNSELYSRKYQTKLIADLLHEKVKGIPMQECTRCLYNTQNYPEIQFDTEGVCDMCRVNEKDLQTLSDVQKKSDVLEFIASIKANRKGKYDCIIGISGGADSSYLVHLAKQWNLNPLLVHVDGGWNNEEAVRNIKNLVAISGFDYYAEVLPWTEIKAVQRSFIQANVLDIDLPFDNLMMSYLYRTAKKHKTNYILAGYSTETEGIMPDIYTHYKLDKRNILNIHKKNNSLRLKSLKFMGTWDFIRYEKIANIRFYKPLDMVGYHKERAKEVLKEHYNWVDYAGKHSENSFTSFYQKVILPEKFGVDKRISHLSILICSGQLTKEEAKKMYAVEEINAEQRKNALNYFIKKLSFTEVEFERYLKSPAESHRNYKSDLDWYEQFGGIYRLLKRYTRLKIFDR